jgi:hypothetical protein
MNWVMAFISVSQQLHGNIEEKHVDLSSSCHSKALPYNPLRPEIRQNNIQEFSYYLKERNYICIVKTVLFREINGTYSENCMEPVHCG